MINTNYWYYSCIRNYILHTLRIFQNFCISEGKDEDGNDILRRIPCTFMSTDKSVVYLLNNATDTVLETCPKMILTLSDVKLENDKISGAPYYEVQSEFTEKKFNEDLGNYEYKPGNSYSITRLNPLPARLIFKLYILTSMLDQKLQLFEQIRSIFSPTLELQVSENPIDWSRVTSITLTDLHWTSKGTNLDSSTLDSLDMEFEVPINIDLPTLVQKQQFIDQIVTSIGEGDSVEDIMGWDLRDENRIYHSPTQNSITVFAPDGCKKCGCSICNCFKIKLNPSKICSTWYQLLNAYSIEYDRSKKNIKVNCLTNANIDKRNDISGTITIDRTDPTIACWSIDDSSLPETNVSPVNGIIEAHNYTPENVIGERYLVTDEISNCKAWGTFLHEDHTKFTVGDKIESGTIIEYTKDGWKVSLNPNKSIGIYYVRDNSQPLNLYTFNNNYKCWVDVICKNYPVGFWRISEKKLWDNYENR